MVALAIAISLASPAPARVTERPGNTLGKVLIAEYHHIAPGKSILYRSPAGFRNDLRRLYDMGFRPVTANDFLAGRFNIPPGASPVVMTFDDAQPTQFRILDNGRIDPNCAIGIWQEFARKHPDFPVKGTFFVLPNMFNQPKHTARKVQILKSLGSELASHTRNHRNLAALSDAAVMREIAGGIDLLAQYGVTEPKSLAFPYGNRPRNMKLLKGFRLNGKPYRLSGAFLAAAEPSRSPKDPKWNRWAIPRVQSCSVPMGLEWWLREMKAERVSLYVQP
jgi:peptidoglycan/xylan/chitin deacetylase (PgdA/CDA1 family)